MNHSRRGHVYLFTTWVEKSILGVLIASTVLSGCGTPTQPPSVFFTPTNIYMSGDPPTGDDHETLDPEPKPVTQNTPSLDMTPIYVAVDESVSMNQTDAAGALCDPLLWRYKIPLLWFRILDEWKQKNVNNALDETILYWMGQSRSYPENGEDKIAILQKRIERAGQSVPSENEGYPQFKSMLEIYRQALREKKKKSNFPTLFIFTDGDFRSQRPVDYNGNVVADEMFDLLKGIKTEFPESKIYFVLMCSRRLDSANFPQNAYLLDTWDRINKEQYATVYGLDKTDIEENLEDSLKSILSEFMGAVNWPQVPESEQQDGERHSNIVGWDVIDAKTQLTLPPNIIYLKLGMIPVDAKQISTPSLTVGLDDSNIPSPPEAIFPLDGCKGHELKFYDISALFFYWWQADVPVFKATFSDGDSEDTYYIYNEQEAKINLNMRVSSHFYPEVYLTSPEKWFDCIELRLKTTGKFFAHTGNNTWHVQYDNVFYNDKNSLSDPIPIEIQGVWLSSPQILFAVENEGYIIPRYFPLFDRWEITEQNPSSLIIHFKIYLKYFAPKYYPQWTEDQWQPRIRFDGKNCLPELKRSQPPQSEATDPRILRYLLTYTTTTDKSPILDISLAGRTGSSLRDCEIMHVEWTNWPKDKSAEGWQEPSNLQCKLIWKENQDILEELNCQ